MRKQVSIVPEGWPCTLGDCPPGHFMSGDELCFKSEYRSNGQIEVYCSSGEAFWGGVSGHDAREALIVQPVIVTLEEVER